LETLLILEQVLCGTFSPLNYWEIHRGRGLHCSVSHQSHQKLWLALYVMSHMTKTKMVTNNLHSITFSLEIRKQIMKSTKSMNRCLFHRWVSAILYGFQS